VRSLNGWQRLWVVATAVWAIAALDWMWRNEPMKLDIEVKWMLIDHESPDVDAITARNARTLKALELKAFPDKHAAFVYKGAAALVAVPLAVYGLGVVAAWIVAGFRNRRKSIATARVVDAEYEVH
jgi:hypothetical protein